MFLKALFLKSYFYLSFFIILVEISGDYLVQHSEVNLIRAVLDNVTHFAVGALCWLQFCLHYRSISLFQTLIETAVCAFLSSLIDLDHFFAARSLKLKDATSLTQRPPLHCTTIPLSIFVVLIALSFGLKSTLLKKVALIVFVAFISHHTRDATRRGYWLCPFGSTPPVPYVVYLFLTILVPYFTIFLNNYIQFGDMYLPVSKAVIEV